MALDCFASLAMTAGELRTRLQRLVDFGFEHPIDIFRRDRADQLVDDRSLAPNDKRLGHAIDAPFDRGTAVAVDTDNAEWVAVTSEEASRIVGRVLVVDADQLQAFVLGQFSQQRRFVMARY